VLFSTLFGAFLGGLLDDLIGDPVVCSLASTMTPFCH
jgi:hypothetical protein